MTLTFVVVNIITIINYYRNDHHYQFMLYLFLLLLLYPKEIFNPIWPVIIFTANKKYSKQLLPLQLLLIVFIIFMMMVTIIMITRIRIRIRMVMMIMITLLLLLTLYTHKKQQTISWRNYVFSITCSTSISTVRRRIHKLSGIPTIRPRPLLSLIMLLFPSLNLTLPCSQAAASTKALTAFITVCSVSILHVNYFQPHLDERKFYSFSLILPLL